MLKGFARLADQLKGQPPEQIVALFTDALNVASRPDEKKALLGALAGQRGLAALQLAASFLKDPAIVDEAALAALQIAGPLADTNKDEAAPIVRQVLAATVSPQIIKQADTLWRKVNKPVNLALGAKATSPDNVDSDGGASGDQAAIDGNPDTYWDETDNQPLYRLRVAFEKPTQVSAINIKGHAYHSFEPKDFEILCDDKVVQTVQNADYDRNTNEFFVAFPVTTCTALELKITGYYGGSPAIRELEIYDLSKAEAKDSAMTEPAQFQWKQTDATLALLNRDRVVWQFNFAKDAPKPYFHPVALADGTELTWLSPPDHPWHRSLWFAWKEINGVNYWEEDPATGKSQGRTEIVAVKASPAPDFFAKIEVDLAYHPPDQPPVLTEHRVLTISAPDAGGGYAINWQATFRADKAEAESAQIKAAVCILSIPNGR